MRRRCDEGDIRKNVRMNLVSVYTASRRRNLLQVGPTSSGASKTAGSDSLPMIAWMKLSSRYVDACVEILLRDHDPHDDAGDRPWDKRGKHPHDFREGCSPLPRLPSPWRAEGRPPRLSGDIGSTSERIRDVSSGPEQPVSGSSATPAFGGLPKALRLGGHVVPRPLPPVRPVPRCWPRDDPW